MTKTDVRILREAAVVLRKRSEIASGAVNTAWLCDAASFAYTLMAETVEKAADEAERKSGDRCVCGWVFDRTGTCRNPVHGGDGTKKARSK